MSEIIIGKHAFTDAKIIIREQVEVDELNQGTSTTKHGTQLSWEDFAGDSEIT